MSRIIDTLKLIITFIRKILENEEVERSLEELLEMIIKQVIADVRNMLKNRNKRKV